MDKLTEWVRQLRAQQTQQTQPVDLNQIEITEEEFQAGAQPQLPEGKIRRAEALKSEGNEFHANKEYRKALRKYHEGVLYVTNLDVPSHMVENRDSLHQALLLNIAACLLKLAALEKDKAARHHRRCIEVTSQVLQIRPAVHKARFRRAQAYIESNEFERAREDIDYIKQHNPTEAEEKEVAVLLQRLEVAEKAEELKQKSVFRRMFS